MKMTYLYIDDDSAERVDGTVEGFKQENFLDVVLNQPNGTWEEQIQFVEQKEREGMLDGLILDLRLDDYPNAQLKKANFRGTSLAQEIRTRQKEGILKPFPIILFSGNDQVSSSLERSGKDLFDICIEKESTNDTNYITYRKKLYALAEGYKLISAANTKLAEILKVNYEIIDERFLSELNDLADEPIHVIAHFLINELIKKQGLLINEKVLAARLGIDISQSTDWTKILNSLSETKYSGVFASGWDRWWMPKIDEWWRNTIEADTYLRSTPTSIRVKLIKEKLGFNDLKPAEKIEKADSDEFWTICKGYNRPLDPVDGLVVEGQENLYPWQDAEFVSIDAAIRRKNNYAWKKVAKLEEERLNELEEQYSKRR
jgi:hypothetical protein